MAHKSRPDYNNEELGTTKSHRTIGSQAQKVKAHRVWLIFVWAHKSRPDYNNEELETTKDTKAHKGKRDSYPRTTRLSRSLLTSNF
jgi:hypothetical protein